MEDKFTMQIKIDDGSGVAVVRLSHEAPSVLCFASLSLLVCSCVLTSPTFPFSLCLFWLLSPVHSFVVLQWIKSNSDVANCMQIDAPHASRDASRQVLSDANLCAAAEVTEAQDGGHDQETATNERRLLPRQVVRLFSSANFPSLYQK